MISITIVGTGTLALHLACAFDKTKAITIRQVIGRSHNTLSNFTEIAPISTDFNVLKNSDVCIIAVSDEAIPDVASKLTDYKGLLVHTSGGTPMDCLLPNKKIGVFYPLQTFTKGRILDFKHIPICIEANTKEGSRLLKELGSTLSDKVEHITSEKRNILHLSAVYVNNFTNYLYTVSAGICEENNIDFELLKPLLLETGKKLGYLSPKEAQTGPAKRGDHKTLHGHLKLLKDPKQREVYKLLSNAIKASYES